ncbi:hypothetical protein DOTSEDRAFT_82412 [Dothistroma septosporum NZE10]|uniref:ATP-dependent RNA helicase n=1 Tax=Dothistroma septosporum (strain NZE10 / CBS 128990) TaxID=675120 RepID=N1PEW1_DOTSN|nr:hypothetical protein DOTSEDRAFT_82412 [Dothistroma septosporum NZE10]
MPAPYITGRTRPTKVKKHQNTLKRKRDDVDVEKLEAAVQELDLKAKHTLFTDLPLSEPTKAGLKSAHFSALTDIQAKAIPLALKGNDILGAAKTGSGKTLAFLIPVLENLYRAQCVGGDAGLGAMVITPTRELAIQIFEVLRKVGGKGHLFAAGLVIGGKSLREEQDALARMNIVTAAFNVDNLKMLVLDEADRILDMGFQRDVDAIVEYLPKERQTMLFSATQTKRVSDLARLSLSDPEYVSVHEASQTATPKTLQQNYVLTPLSEKLDTLWSFLQSAKKSKMIVFLSSAKQVRFVYESFRHMQPGIPLLHLHGRQKETTRLETTQKFASAKHSCLFATDVVARGVDFPAVDWVVQVDCPEDADTYIHRVGRTARYEKEGRAILFMDPSEEEGMLSRLEQKKVPIERINVRAKKQQSIKNQLQNMCFQDPKLKYLGQKAFVSYVRSLHIQKDKEIFKLDKYNLEDFAASLGLPGAPRIKFLKADQEEVKRRKNASRQAAISASEDDKDEDEEGDKVKSKKNGVRTKYDRMFERQNQDILADHYAKLVKDDHRDNVDLNRLDGEQDGDDDLFNVKRRIPVQEGEANIDSVADMNAKAPGARAVEIPGAKVPIVVDSKRREKLLKSKKKLLNFKDKGHKIVYDDEGNAHEVYELEDEDDFRARGEAEQQRRRFLEEEAERVKSADLEDKALAKEKRRSKKEKARERERAEHESDGEGAELDHGEDAMANFIADAQGPSDSEGERSEKSEADDAPRKKQKKWFQEEGRRKDLGGALVWHDSVCQQQARSEDKRRTSMPVLDPPGGEASERFTSSFGLPIYSSSISLSGISRSRENKEGSSISIQCLEEFSYKDTKPYGTTELWPTFDAGDHDLDLSDNQDCIDLIAKARSDGLCASFKGQKVKKSMLEAAAEKAYPAIAKAKKQTPAAPSMPAAGPLTNPSMPATPPMPTGAQPSAPPSMPVAAPLPTPALTAITPSRPAVTAAPVVHVALGGVGPATAPVFAPAERRTLSKSQSLVKTPILRLWLREGIPSLAAVNSAPALKTADVEYVNELVDGIYLNGRQNGTIQVSITGGAAPSNDHKRAEPGKIFQKLVLRTTYATNGTPNKIVTNHLALVPPKQTHLGSTGEPADLCQEAVGQASGRRQSQRRATLVATTPSTQPRLLGDRWRLICSAAPLLGLDPANPGPLRLLNPVPSIQYDHETGVQLDVEQVEVMYGTPITIQNTPVGALFYNTAAQDFNDIVPGSLTRGMNAFLTRRVSNNVGITNAQYTLPGINISFSNAQTRALNQGKKQTTAAMGGDFHSVRPGIKNLFININHAISPFFEPMLVSHFIARATRGEPHYNWPSSTKFVAKQPGHERARLVRCSEQSISIDSQLRSGDQFEETDARTLQAPEVIYRQLNSPNAKTAAVSNASCNLAKVAFATIPSTTMQELLVLRLENAFMPFDFGDTLWGQLRTHGSVKPQAQLKANEQVCNPGMVATLSHQWETIFRPDLRSFPAVQAHLHRQTKRTLDAAPDSGPVVVVVMPGHSYDDYAYIKRVGDLQPDINTICVLGDKLHSKDWNVQKASNLALKFNIMGSANMHNLKDPYLAALRHAGQHSSVANTIVLGADVAHPSKGCLNGTPSVSAVVGTVDDFFMQYRGSMCLQRGRNEEIGFLQEMIEERIND